MPYTTPHVRGVDGNKFFEVLSLAALAELRVVAAVVLKGVKPCEDLLFFLIGAGVFVVFTFSEDTGRFLPSFATI